METVTDETHAEAARICREAGVTPEMVKAAAEKLPELAPLAAAMDSAR